MSGTPRWKVWRLNPGGGRRLGTSSALLARLLNCIDDSLAWCQVGLVATADVAQGEQFWTYHGDETLEVLWEMTSHGAGIRCVRLCKMHTVCCISLYRLVHACVFG